MQRSIAIALLLLILGTGVYFWLLRAGGTPLAPSPDPGQPVAAQPEAETSVTASDAQARRSAPEASQRVEIAIDTELLDDPEIKAGLSGFRGRVVTHDGVPVADCGVRFYRGAIDTILNRPFDLFADGPSVAPNYVAGETRTSPDGAFVVTGVWPNGFYIMLAGLGTEAPMHEVITKTPSPGEIVDLGDVVLPDAGVIVGEVLDAEGEPLQGALVRAADVPGTLASFFPVERFDPHGALLIRERGVPSQVIEMPSWVEDAFERFPVPTTRTDGAGRFRLVGVVPGSNMLAVTAADHLADVKPSVQVRAGQEKDVGTIRLREGEELFGKVLDTAGKPVAEAEVFAGSTIAIVPIDLARRIGKTDAKGQFSALGFAPGKVTVAARRGPGHAWVLAEPQPILGDVVVTLPAAFAADVTVTLADGAPAKDARLRLLHGNAGDGAAEMAVFGFVPPVDLGGRLVPGEADGCWRITNLLAGKYTLIAEAPGHATGFVGFGITDTDATASLQLKPTKEFAVRVVDHEEKPIRNAAITATAVGQDVFDMPLFCGRTKTDGALRIDEFQADTLRVSAEHPKWGVVHGEARLGEELVLRMQPPGSLEGVLTENGAPPAPGKWTVVIEWRRTDGPRGATEQVPRLVTPGTDGRFRVAALQPGQYRLQALDSISALRSPGAMVQMMMSFSMGGGNRQRETVEVIAGQAAQVHLDTGERPIEGPTARVYGSVVVDGRLAEGYRVQGWIGNRRYVAEVDQAGRFDLGTVPAGDGWITVSSTDGFLGVNGTSLWSSSVKLEEAEEKELVIDILTTSMSGMVVDRTGLPSPGMHVIARGRLKNGRNTVHLFTPVDANGAFTFEKVPEGTWTLEVQSGGEGGLRGKLADVELIAGVPMTDLRIDVAPSIVVSGSLDLTMFGAEKPPWAWVSIHKLTADGSAGDQVAGLGIDMDDGAFSTNELSVGTYAVRVHASGQGNRTFRCQDIAVPPQGVTELVLRGVPE